LTEDELRIALGLQDEIEPLIGDVNGDGIFNSSDLTCLFQAGKYEDGLANNATFEEGGWNGDGDFDSSDLVLAFQIVNYVREAVPLKNAAAAVDWIFENDNVEDDEIGEPGKLDWDQPEIFLA
jgi:hypothetical protein